MIISFDNDERAAICALNPGLAIRPDVIDATCKHANEFTISKESVRTALINYSPDRISLAIDYMKLSHLIGVLPDDHTCHKYPKEITSFLLRFLNIYQLENVSYDDVLAALEPYKISASNDKSTTYRIGASSISCKNLGTLHSKTGPAVVINGGDSKYYLNGDVLSIVEWDNAIRDGMYSVTDEYCDCWLDLDGTIHRTDGPAMIEKKNGAKHYYLHGIRFKEKEFYLWRLFGDRIIIAYKSWNMHGDPIERIPGKTYVHIDDLAALIDPIFYDTSCIMQTVMQYLDTKSDFRDRSYHDQLSIIKNAAFYSKQDLENIMSNDEYRKLVPNEDPEVMLDYVNAKNWSYLKNGKPHNEFGAAKMTDGLIAYYLNGENYTLSEWQEAIRDGIRKTFVLNTCRWYKQDSGVLHRLNGPAHVSENGVVSHYLSGTYLSNEEFDAWHRLKEFFYLPMGDRGTFIDKNGVRSIAPPQITFSLQDINEIISSNPGIKGYATWDEPIRTLAAVIPPTTLKRDIMRIFATMNVAELIEHGSDAKYLCDWLNNRDINDVWDKIAHTLDKLVAENKAVAESEEKEPAVDKYLFVDTSNIGVGFGSAHPPMPRPVPEMPAVAPKPVQTAAKASSLGPAALALGSLAALSLFAPKTKKSLPPASKKLSKVVKKEHEEDQLVRSPKR